MAVIAAGRNVWPEGQQNRLSGLALLMYRLARRNERPPAKRTFRSDLHDVRTFQRPQPEKALLDAKTEFQAIAAWGSECRV